MALLFAALLAQGSSPWPKPHVFTSGGNVIRVPAHVTHHKAEFKFTLPKGKPVGLNGAPRPKKKLIDRPE